MIALKKTKNKTLTVENGKHRHEGIVLRLHFPQSAQGQLREAGPRDVGDHHVLRLVFSTNIYQSMRDSTQDERTEEKGGLDY